VDRVQPQGTVIGVNPVRTTFHKAGILPVPGTFAKSLQGGCAYEFLWQFAQVIGFFCQIFSFFSYALKTWLFPVEKLFWRAAPGRLESQLVWRDTRAQLSVSHRVSPYLLSAGGR
jgi:hypothetical protein